MAAKQTVPQHPQQCNFTPITPKHGVVTLFGYGINVHVNHGHLIFQDGIGPVRREGRLPRVRHGLRRLVVVGSDGMVSLAALRWLADQDASFVMLDRNGSVLATTGPVRTTDARLRRAQALAQQSGVALHIVRDLIAQKLVGQERLAREKLADCSAADTIARMRADVSRAGSMQEIRLLEANAAYAYWSAWRGISIMFSKMDLRRVPHHWLTFGSRVSPLTASPRLAVNPANAILNYLYALLESETRLATAAVGLDPALGLLHADTQWRDNLACDLMEPVRPQVDAYLLDWITRGVMRREWFFEERTGTCRLMGSFTVGLSETAMAWRQAVSPIVETVVRNLSSTMRVSARQIMAATHLTQRHRREAKGRLDLPVLNPPRPPKLCSICGSNIPTDKTYCASCAVGVRTEALVKAAQKGRVAAQSAEAQASRAENRKRNAAAQRVWRQADKPAWLNERTYQQKIQPRLSAITIPALMSALNVSKPYAADIRAGRRQPHPRHWLILARLVDVASEDQE
jgi:CRISPR-associated endonuclease Cas1